MVTVLRVADPRAGELGTTTRRSLRTATIEGEEEDSPGLLTATQLGYKTQNSFIVYKGYTVKYGGDGNGFRFSEFGSNTEL